MKIEQFDYSVNIEKAILWQYDNATSLISLITQKQAWYDINQTQFWIDWYNNVFNMYTANKFGLSVWSIILNIPFFVSEYNSSKPTFGFNQKPPVNNYVNFNRGNFASFFQSSRIILTVEEQRVVLKLRYFQLTSRGAIPATNYYLNVLFNDPLGAYQGGIWELDGLNMTVTFVINCNISANLLEVIKTYELLPVCTGVGVKYYDLRFPTFGFGKNYLNFNRGYLYPIT